MAFPVEAYHAEIAQIVADVFVTMLGCGVIERREDWEPPAGSVTATIYFAGTWKGAVLVEASEEQARRWTSELMSIPEPSMVNEDVHDAMGEIVNMVAGNLKSVVPNGVAISMPTVVEGKQYSVRVCGGNLVHRQSFVSEGRPFRVTFVEMLDP